MHRFHQEFIQKELERIRSFFQSEMERSVGPPRLLNNSYYAYTYFFPSLAAPSRKGIVIKNILPWQLEMLTPDEKKAVILFFNDSVLSFREGLKRLGVSIIENYQCYAIQERAYHVMSYAGENIDKILRDKNGDGSEELFSRVCQCIRGVLLHSDELEVGLDGLLSNFCVDSEGKVQFIDYVPALCVFRGTLYVHYPNPKSAEEIDIEKKRKFTPLGIIRRMHFSARTIHPELQTSFFSALENTLGKEFARKIEEYFGALKFRTIQQLLQKKDYFRIRGIIDGLMHTEVEDMREIGQEVIAADDPQRKEKMKLLFEHSSFYNSSNPNETSEEHEKRYERGKALLRECVQKL